MSGLTHYTPFRGHLTALIGFGTQLVVATAHPEGDDTGVWLLDGAKDFKDARQAPGIPGATAMVADARAIYIAGSDGKLWQSNHELGAVKDLGLLGESSAVAITLFGEEHLAIGLKKRIIIASKKTGAHAHVIETQEELTALGVDATGTWLVAGTAGGTLLVWQQDDRGAPKLANSARIHEGRITALCFDPADLQVLSAGQDSKLLVTYIRGKIDPQDRGGSDLGEKPTTAILFGPDERFYTAGFDRAIKAWPKGRNKKRPASQGAGVPKVVAMDVVTYNKRPHLVVLGTDQSVRFFGFEDDGKVAPLALTLLGAMDAAKQLLGSKEVGDRHRAIADLARYGDKTSLDLLIKHAGKESDHKLLLFLTKSLIKTGDPYVTAALERLLEHRSADAQEAALRGLMALETQKPLRPLTLAMDKSQDPVARLAVRELGVLARDHDDALDALIKALDHGKTAVRLEALGVLVDHHKKNRADAYLLGLYAQQPDVRVAAIIGCHHDAVLDNGQIEAALRRLCEDTQELVRIHAFYVSLYRKPSLTLALRARDKEFHRAFFEIEQAGKVTRGEEKPPEAAAFALGKLKEEDVDPLLEAMASSQVDVCIQAARALAVLEDSRALGTLLQLSRHQADTVRLTAAKALGTLGDPSGISRLQMMLRDAAPGVRDAAFSGLGHFKDTGKMELAKVGLYAAHEDVNKRGLHVLTTHMKTKAGKADKDAYALLKSTLNNQFAPVRTEAFKAALGLEIDGTHESALRFSNQSVHADVRKNVLTEVMAAYKEGWAWNMLLEFYEDAEHSLRESAFEFAVEKAKKERRHQALATALQSTREEVRLWGLEELTKKRLQDVEDLMLKALEDESSTVRTKTVEALIEAGAHDLLKRALTSSHTDVQLFSAIALAETGYTAALTTLVGIATTIEPDKDKDPKAHSLWLGQVSQALDGIAKLGEPGAEQHLLSLLASPYEMLRQSAARAIVWTASKESVPLLVHMLHHDEPGVRHEAAFGLAYLGDTSASSLVSGYQTSIKGQVAKNAADQSKLLAAFGLLEKVPEFLTSLLDDSELIRRQAFLLILLLCQAQRPDAMSLCLGALSSQHADIRLEAAKAFEAYTDPDTFLEFVRTELGSLLATGKQPFEISEEATQTLSLVLVHGSVQVKLRALGLLKTLNDDQPKGFERAWELFSGRYAADLQALRTAHAPAAKPGRLERAWGALKGLASGDTASEKEAALSLLRLAFGAYVGLARDHADAPARVGAMRRLGAMSRHKGLFAQDIQRVMLMSLGDTQQQVRALAFDSLLESGFDPQSLANEALSTSYTDMGSKGLDLLAKHAGGGNSGIKLLQDVMLQKTDGLEIEAANLLEPQMPWAAFWALGLGAKSPSWRQRSLDVLHARMKEDPDARKALGQALSSRFEETRFGAATMLAEHDVPTAQKKALIPVLKEMLWSRYAPIQQQAAQAIVRLKDPDLAPLLLDRLDDDPDKDASQMLITYLGQAGDLSVFDRVLERIEHQKGDQSKTFHAALALTGYDQKIKGGIDTPEHIKEWSADQRPRHTAPLVKLLDLSTRLARADMTEILIPQAKWAIGQDVDAALSLLLTSSNEAIQFAAIQAYGWRLKWRSAPPAPLTSLLGTTSATAQFLAAEGLALASHDQGLGVLMTAVSFLEDHAYRQRAVLAIGQLGNPQTLPLLLGIAQDPEHDLREAAIEAIGHLSTSDKSEEIFGLLVSMTLQLGSGAQSAIKGLAHFGTDQAWQQIRRLATSTNAWTKQHAIEALGAHKDPESQALLTKILLHDVSWNAANAALSGLRASYGDDSLEPDYLQLQARQASLQGWESIIGRLTERGDPARLLELLPRIPHTQFVDQLVAFLVESQPLEAAAASLNKEALLPAMVATKIIAYAGQNAKPHQKALLHATAQAAATWEALRAQPIPDHKTLTARASRLSHLLWACGQVEVGLDEIIHAASRFDDPLATEPCQIALNILGFDWVGKKGVDTYIGALESEIPKHREIAAIGLRAVAPEIANEKLPQTLDDAILFAHLKGDPMQKDTHKVATQGLDTVHHQGVVLQTIVAHRDVASLAKVLHDQALGDEVRLGALEALSMIATPQTDGLLAGIGQNEDEDEDLRKSAWRALRRSKKLRARRDQKEVAP